MRQKIRTLYELSSWYRENGSPDRMKIVYLELNNYYDA